MPRGSKCSFCNELKFHLDDETESFSQCSNCGFVGWGVGDPVKPGQGRGFRCINCQKPTFHFLAKVTDKVVEMFRCSVCRYAGVRPILS